MEPNPSILPESDIMSDSSLLSGQAPIQSVPPKKKPTLPAQPVPQFQQPLAAPAPLPQQQPQPDLRAFDDVAKTRQRIYDNVLNAVQNLEPVKNNRYTLRLSGVQYADPDRFSKKDQKQAILTGLSLGRRIKGTWELVDNETEQVVSKKQQVLMSVPHLTERGTYINDGTEYGLKNQQRLLPGVYTRIQENGDIESHANVLPGKGVSHRYYLDPEQGTFKIKIGQAHVGLLPLLRVMGVSDKELEDSWGRDLVYANRKADTAAEREKLYGKFLSARELDGTEQEKQERLKTKFESMELDPEVNQRTLGQPFDRLNKDAVLSITQKLLKVSRGEEQPDDRDALPFQRFVGPEDLFAERIARDKGGLRRQLLWKATGRGNLDNMPSSILNKQVKAALLSSGLGEALEETNPAQIYDKLSAVSRVGEGGISSVDSIPIESRSVQPSMLGFIDPLRTPESGKVGVDTYLTRSARKGADGKLYSEFLDAKTGEKVYKTPAQASDMTVAFSGAMSRDGSHVVAMKGGELDYVKKDAIDLVVPTPEDMFNQLSNIIPMKSSTKGQRLVMATRMTTQALPLVHSEAPLVQSAVPGTNGTQSFEEQYASAMGAIKASQGGTVLSVDGDEMKVRYDDGTEETHDLYKDFALNRKTAINQTPIVQPGARFEPNQILARSNYTDKNGVTALGTNARTAYMAWEGKNFEDAIVVSESFAKKTTSEHSYQHGLSVDDKTKVGKNQFLAAFPGKYDRKVLDNFDASGLVKPGTEVHYGDPLILGIQTKDLAHNKMHRSKQQGLGDASVTWDHHDSGVVTDAVMGREGPVVVVRSLSETKAGDKMCYDPQTEILTKDGWKLVGEVGVGELIASLNPETDEIEWVPAVATHRYEHTGPMYRLETIAVDLLVTDNHRLYAKKKRSERYELLEARSLFGKSYKQKRNGIWNGGRSPEFVVLPALTVSDKRLKSGERYLPELRVPAETYAMLLGMFLSEGSLFDESGKQGIDICQEKEPNRQQMIEALDAAGIKYQLKPDRVRIFDRQWYTHFRNNCGLLSHYRKMPRKVFNWDRDLLEVLYEWMMWGDGCRKPNNHRYTTVSQQLADDMQVLCLLLGLSANIATEDEQIRFISGKAYQARRVYRISIYRARNEPETRRRPSRSAGHKQKWQVETWVQYSGDVYCVTLAKNHVMYVRRNGKPVWCGNSARYGDKGIISEVIPDHKMPVGEDGKPYEVLLNPAGLATRTNASQMAELWLGKIAAAKGQPIKVEDFDDKRDMMAWVEEQLKEAGIKSTEDLEDPSTGRRISGIATGNRFFMKLHHSAESKLQGRGSGAYTAEGMPAKVGDAKSKRVGLLETNALLSHGATGVLEDAKMVRGQQNTNYWMQFMSGHTPRIEKVPHVYEKFVAQLKASGVNVVQDGPKMNIMALTDKDVSELAGDREITSSAGVDWGDKLQELPGGFFDKAKTGGHGGAQWAYFKLAQPMPNPVMEEPIRRLLDLTQKKFDAVIAGQEELPKYGTGSQAIAKALSAVNVDSEIENARNTIKSGRKSFRDAAVRKLGYLKSMKKMSLSPSDYMLTKVPVLPPQFRPVSMMGSDMPLVDDANFLYKELFEANKNYERSIAEFGHEGAGAEAASTYAAFKAVTGLGDPIGAKTQEKQVKGALKHVFGTSPKYGTMQRKLLSSTVDNVGRGVISPNPDLDMDSIGMPESMAFDAYDRYVTRELVRRGMPMARAREEIVNRSKVAKAVLVDEMEKRPVIASRAPVLHKFGIMAFKPKLVQGNTLHLSPLIIKGFGADFDGNCVTGDTRIKLQIDTRKFATPEHEAWYLSLQRAVAKADRSTVAFDRTDPYAVNLSIPIDVLPRHGEFKLDRNGARVYELPPGVSIATVDVAKGVITVDPLTHFTCEDDHACAKVHYASRRTASVSDNESLATYDPETGTLKKTAPHKSIGLISPRIVHGILLTSTQGTAADGEALAESKFLKTADVCAVRRFLNSASRDAQLGFFLAILRNAGVFKAFEKRPFSEFHTARCDYQKRYTPDDISILYQLAQNLGIDVRITRAPGDNTEVEDGWDERHTVHWDVRDIVSVLPQHIVRDYDLTAWRNSLRQNVGPRANDYVPVPRAVLDLFDSFYRARDSRILAWVNKLRKDGFGTRTMLKQRARRVMADTIPSQLPPEFEPWYDLINNSDIRWDKVLRCEDLPNQPVYDIVVPTTKVYSIENGLIIYDTMNAHVPATERAIRDAYDRLLPSKNLISPADFKSVVHAPINEFVAGLYTATSRKLRSKRPERVFRSAADARKAYEAGDISANDPVVIMEDKAGR